MIFVELLMVLLLKTSSSVTSGDDESGVVDTVVGADKRHGVGDGR